MLMAFEQNRQYLSPLGRAIFNTLYAIGYLVTHCRSESQSVLRSFNFVI